MKIQRRDLFRAAVAGFLGKFVPPALASAAATPVIAAVECIHARVGVKLLHVRERIHQPFRDSLIRTSGFVVAPVDDRTSLFTVDKETGPASS